MKALRLATVILAIFVGVGTVNAASYTFDAGAGLSSLSHWNYYTWGIDFDLADGEKIDSVTLNFENFYNYNNDPNDLYVHLLESATPGVQVGWDWYGFGDAFAGQGELLVQLQNLTSTPTNITYSFDLSEIASLEAFISDGNFGLGFDSDCYYVGNISLDIETSPVPIPSSILLLGSSLLGLVRLRKRSDIE